MFTNINLTDMENCYKVFKSEIIKEIDLKENRFGFEPEVTAKISKKKFSLVRVRLLRVGVWRFWSYRYSKSTKFQLQTPSLNDRTRTWVS